MNSYVSEHKIKERGHSMKNKFNSNGLTLIEVIITLAILGVVVTPLMSMFITSQKINRESEMKYNAIQLAQEQMEEIKADNTLDVSSGSGYTGADGDYEKSLNDDGYRLDIGINKSEEVELEDVDTVEVPDTFDQVYNVAVSTTTNITATKNDENIRVNLLTDNGKLMVNNSFTGVKLYLYKTDDDYAYTVSGNGTVIEVQEGMDKLDNILYYITIKVYKDAKLIETVKGSKVFSKIITD